MKNYPFFDLPNSSVVPLTPEQEERVQALYSEDIALLESLPIT